MHVFVPWARILSSPVGLWVLGGWTSTTIVLINAAAALDGGPGSPIAWLVVVPVIAGAMSYPPRAVLGVGALGIISHLAIAVVSGVGVGPATLLQAAVLAIIAAMCAMTSANHRRTAAKLRHTARNLEELATTDSLTGCANHRAFQEHLRREVAGAQDEERQLSLLLMDLDHFKAINDTHGHPSVTRCCGRWVRACGAWCVHREARGSRPCRRGGSRQRGGRPGPRPRVEGRPGARRRPGARGVPADRGHAVGGRGRLRGARTGRWFEHRSTCVARPRHRRRAAR
jgi:hypothetical protein